MISFSNALFQVNPYAKLNVEINDFKLQPKDLIVLLGQNGSGKTVIAKALSGKLELISGETNITNKNAQLVSFEEQQALFDADYNMRNSDTTTLKEEKGLLPLDLFAECNKADLDKVVCSLNLEHLLERPIRNLSGGEGRKVLIAKALCNNPDLLVFDTPFDALDVPNRQQLLQIIEGIHHNYDTPIVLIVNRPDEIPASLTSIGIISDLKISKLLDKNGIASDEEAQALLYAGNLPKVELPRAPQTIAKSIVHKLTSKDDPLVKFNKVNIQYDRKVLDNLDFTVNQGEHWQITGPNGAGKSTILSLITGDNPLVYTNDISVFGYKRGSGESIWDIKRCFGYISGALHLDYRVSSSALNVVLSGFHDSIGLYTKPGDEEVAVARQWLKLVGLADKEKSSFKSLSFGQQRLLLIVRALVKNPPLLILDEPLQGLDAYSRALVQAFITYVMEQGNTSILFVSHHLEDAPQGITHRLSFVPNESNSGFNITQEKLCS